MDVRTRFAPSPTGYMHIGNLRTALYSYLIARRNNGKFILRIEDTDKNRYVDDAINVIYNTLNTAGLNYDEGPDKGGNVGPYIQSSRLDIYKNYAEELVKLGKAYYCFCPEAKTDLDTYKEETNYTTGIGYNRHCRNLTKEEITENLKNNIPYCIRQKIEDDILVEYEDTVYGKLTFNSSTLDDQVLLKQDGYPTYNFANVIDDHLMGITHVVRGNEYLSSTPKYILLYKAFNWEIPTFIHLPLINGMDENGNISKLSKRHGAVSFEELVKNGYLPEAILNYIVFLGWNSKTTQEIFSLKELENVFEIKNINKADALFDYKKLEWYNSYYIKQLTDKQFYEIGKTFLKEKANLFNWSRTSLYIKEKITKFSDVLKELQFLIILNKYDNSLFENKKNKVSKENVIPFIDYMMDILKSYPENSVITKTDYELIMRKYAEINNVKFGHPMWIFRIALSGQQNTIIGGLEIAEILDITEVKNRLNFAREKFNEN